MTFSFLGMFAEPAPRLQEAIKSAWPDAHVRAIDIPFRGVAARLSSRLYEPAAEDMPDAVIDTALSISAAHPKIKLLLLRAECWGGQCFYWGQILLRGKGADPIEGKQALRRLVAEFGVDIGEREFFEPLMRNYPWTA